MAPEHLAVRSAAYDLADGWTYLGDVEGAYRMGDGTESRDRSAAYFVVLDATRVGEWEEVLRRFNSRTLQEAVYLEVARVEVRFVK